MTLTEVIVQGTHEYLTLYSKQFPDKNIDMQLVGALHIGLVVGLRASPYFTEEDIDKALKEAQNRLTKDLEKYKILWNAQNAAPS